MQDLPAGHVVGHLFGGVGRGVGVGIGVAVRAGVGIGVGVGDAADGPFMRSVQPTVSISCLRCMNEQSVPIGLSFR